MIKHSMTWKTLLVRFQLLRFLTDCWRLASVWSRAESTLWSWSVHTSCNFLNIVSLKGSFKFFDLQNDHSEVIFLLTESKLKLSYFMRKTNHSLMVKFFLFFEISINFHVFLFKFIILWVKFKYIFRSQFLWTVFLFSRLD